MTQKILTELPQVSFDKVKTPSEGLYYDEKSSMCGKKEIEVEYMTGKEQDILLSPTLLESGEVIDRLIDMKIKDTSINPDDMFPGDINAIMIFLRSTGIGDKYETNIPCPHIGCKFINDYTWILSEFQPKELIKKGEPLIYVLPKQQHEVVYRFTVRKDENEIVDLQQSRKEKLGQGSEKLGGLASLRREKQVISIGGNTDRFFISEYLKRMPYSDAEALRSEIQSREPGIDTTKEIKCNGCKKVFRAAMPITPSFFWPDYRI